MRKPVSNRQFLDSEILIVAWDATGTTNPAVLRGGNQCTVVRSNGNGTRDRITITFKKAMFGMTPAWVAQPTTLDCELRDVAGTTDKTKIVIDAVKSSNTATSVTDAAGQVIIFGPFTNKEGNY
jgi:hypothetical protein